MLTYRTLFTLCLAVFLFPATGSAQSWARYTRGPKGLEVGYSYCVAGGQFSYRDLRFNERTLQLRDTGYTENLRSKTGFGATVGYYWPVVRVGQKSCLAITGTFMYNAYLWDGNTFSYSANSQTGVVESVGSGTIEMALPVGLDYKVGADAIYDKVTRFCGSVGAGVYPSMGATVYKGDGSFGFHARPYIRGEVGIFAGICFKLRVTHVLGGINYIDYSDAGPGYETSTVFKSKGTTAFSLILMPWSWKWGKSAWWQ